MNRIIAYFERNDKKVIDINIVSKINRKCEHCGYGTTYTGHATLLDINESCEDDNSKDDNCENNKGHEVDFVYWSGCLSYDEEMQYE